jgi:hypothetical protein
MALKWSEIQASDEFKNADPEGQSKQRVDFLSKVKPEMSAEGYKILEDRVMIKEQPSNQYGTSTPEPMPEVPFDINTGIQYDANAPDQNPGMPWGQAPTPINEPGVPEVREQNFDDMKWSEFTQTELFKASNPQSRNELAEQFLARKERFMSTDGFNVLRDKVRQSLMNPQQLPAVVHKQEQQEPGFIKRQLGKVSLGLYGPYPKPITAPQKQITPELQEKTAEYEQLWSGGGDLSPIATREEMVAAGITEPSKTEEAIGLKEPRLKTLADIQGLQDPGVVGSMINPAEAAAMGMAGATIAMRFGKPIMATTLDYALAGAPSIAKGIKGFAVNVAGGGARGVARIAASRNVPVSNTIDMLEAPLLDSWAEASASELVKSGKWGGKTYAEAMSQYINDTKSSLIKYFKDNNFTPDEIDIFLKTGDVPPTVPQTETRFFPGPGRDPTQLDLNLKLPGHTTETTKLLPGPERAEQLGLPLEKPPLTQPPPEGPIVVPGKTMQIPTQKIQSAVTPDDLDHPYLGNLNSRIARSGSYIKGGWQAAMQYIENPIRMFMKAGGNLKREVYDRIEDADMSALREFHDRFIPQINEWKKKANAKRLAVYMINRQDDGPSILKNMGINVNKTLAKMTPDEMSIANQMDDFYREFYHRINVARIKSGLPEMGKRKDYFTFYRQMDWLEKNMGYNPMEAQNLDEILANKFIHPNSTYFGEALSRANNDFIPVELDAFQSFGKYSQNALNHINISPEIARGRKVIGQISKSHPELHSDITNWLDFVSGKQNNVLHPILRRALLSTNKRVALSVLSWNFRTMLVQPTALKNTVAKAGVADTLGGIQDVLMSSKPLRWMSKAGQAKADLVRQNSNLLGRKFDVAVDDILKLAKGPIQKIGKAGMRPMQELDMLTAEASWHAFYRQGTKQGLKGKDLIRYANDNVVLTQASGRKQHLARIQRSDLGRLASTLQTFVINDWGFMTEEVLGMGKNVPMTKANIGRVYRWIGGTILTNMFFEDVLNIHSPYPTPIRRTMEEINKKDASFWSVAKGLGSELTDVAPLIGSAVRYSTGMWGPTVEAGRRLMEGEKPWEQAAKLTGIPMSFLKVPARIQEGKSVKAVLLGEKEKEKKKKKTMRPMSSGGSIGGNKKNKPKPRILMTPLS